MENEIRIRKSTKNLVFMALMCAITIILTFTPIGMIQLIVISFTIAHIPTIVTSIVLGPFAGAMMGIIFGLCSLIKALTAGKGLDLFFINPLVSVLPRLLIGITSYYSYTFTKNIFANARKGKEISIFTGACVGSLTNTIGCLGMLYILYAVKIVEIVGQSAEVFILSIIGTAGITEMIASSIIAFYIITVANKKYNTIS